MHDARSIRSSPLPSGQSLVELGENEVQALFQLGDFRPFAWLDEGDRDAFPTGPRGPTTAVGVILDLFWKLVVDDEMQAFDINPARRDIRGDEELEPPLGE